MEQSYKIQDNFVIDTDTGEILGEVVVDGAIASQEALEIVLERIARVETELVGLQARHSAILENCKRIEKRKADYLAYLKSRYSSPIEEYVKARLEGGKSRTLTTPYGSVSFRVVKGGLKVVDKTLALETAIGLGMTNAIKTTQEFQISKLTDEQLDTLYYSLPQGFDFVSDRETMSIKVVN